MKEKWIPHIIAVMCLVFFMVLGLGSGTPEGSVKKDNSSIRPQQETAANSDFITLDQALKEAASRIDERIPIGSKIAPLNFNSPHDKFSDYVLEELTANLVESRKLTVVDRREIDLIRNEFDFQLSGDVGDDSMQQIGRMLGAQSIISGNFTDMGGFVRIMIRVLNVQNASVEVQYRANVASDAVTTALLTGGKKNVAVTTPRQTTSGGSSSAVQDSATTAIPPLVDGTYTFNPRIQATQGARNVSVYLGRVVVLRGYITFYIYAQPRGDGGYTESMIGNWGSATVKDMDTNRNGRLVQAVPKAGVVYGSVTIYELTFQNVTGKRLSLASPDSPPIEFYDIVLDRPDN